jgi:hypothetical protein
MAMTLANREDHRRALSDYFEHGHCGFAWAARRHVLDRHHLYDRCVLGGADVVMAHCFYGDADFWRGRNFVCRQMSKKELASIAGWGRPLFDDVQGRVFYTPGRVLHLWHGGMEMRNYQDRLRILKENDFDPANDIAFDSQDCWRWNSAKPDLHLRTRQYFDRRSSELPQATSTIAEGNA